MFPSLFFSLSHFPNSLLPLPLSILIPARRHPESVVVINADVIDSSNSYVINTLFDDTLLTLGNDVNVRHAVFILLSDLAKDADNAQEVTHEFIEEAVRKRWPGRVAERVHPYVVL